ncbi:MAG: oligosaccharide flippase family protein [Endomicrobiaceae bacterium]|nr:oligosaccharide flippase family protein [Endomicrobiaceae bacterium]
MNNKYKSLIKNTTLVFVGRIGSNLLQFLMLPFYTKWLSTSQYGMYDLILVYVSILAVVVSCKIESAIFVYPKDRTEEEQKNYFSSGLVFLIILFSILSISFFVINIFYNDLNKNVFFKYIWFIYLLILFNIIFRYIQQFCRAIDKIFIYAVSGLFFTLISVIFSFILIPKYGLNGYVYSQFIGFVFGILTIIFTVKIYKFISFKHIKINYAKKMLVFSLPLIPTTIMWWLVTSLNKPLIETYCGLAVLGIFAIATRFSQIPAILNDIFCDAWQISVLEEFNNKDYSVYYNKMFNAYFVFQIFCSIIFAVFSKSIIEVFTAKNYWDAWYYIPFLVLSGAMSNISAFVAVNFTAARETRYYFYSSIVGLIASIGLNFALIPYYGVYGAIVSFFVCGLVQVIIRIYFSWKWVVIINIWKYIINIIYNILIVLLVISHISIYLKYSLLMFVFVLFLLFNKNIIYMIFKQILSGIRKKLIINIGA